MNALNLKDNGGVELKPCAHCGGKAVTSFCVGYNISCETCGIGIRKRLHPGIYHDWKAQKAAEQRQAVAIWNRRSEETPSEIERCMK